MIITSRRMAAKGGETKLHGSWDEEESFDVFSLDLLRAKRQILRYSLDEKLLLTRVSLWFSF